MILEVLMQLNLKKLVNNNNNIIIIIIENLFIKINRFFLNHKIFYRVIIKKTNTETDWLVR